MHTLSSLAFFLVVAFTTPAQAQDMGGTTDDCPDSCWMMSADELEDAGIDCSGCETGSDTGWDGDTGDSCSYDCDSGFDDWDTGETDGDEDEDDHDDADTGDEDDCDGGPCPQDNGGKATVKSKYQKCLDTDDLRECYACCLSESSPTRCQDECDTIVDGFDAQPFGPPTSIWDILADEIGDLFDKWL